MSPNTCPEEGTGSNLANPCSGTLRNPETAACQWLRAQLAQGPVDSAALKTAATTAGIGPKALRKAREALMLLVTRSGCGKSMKSTWALPTDGTSTGPRPDGPEMPKSTPSRPGAHASDLGTLEPGEVVWRDRRVAYFLSKGIGQGLASDVAAALVERDRRSRVDPEALHIGSCAECQMLEVAEARCQPGSDGNTNGPRPLTEVWLCWPARRPL